VVLGLLDGISCYCGCVENPRLVWWVFPHYAILADHIKLYGRFDERKSMSEKRSDSLNLEREKVGASG
jgi:hypothetical protein